MYTNDELTYTKMVGRAPPSSAPPPPRPRRDNRGKYYVFEFTAVRLLFPEFTFYARTTLVANVRPFFLPFNIRHYVGPDYAFAVSWLWPANVYRTTKTIVTERHVTGDDDKHDV